MEDQGFIAGAYERMLRLQRAAPGYPSYQEGSQEQADGGVYQRKLVEFVFSQKIIMVI